MSDKYLNVDIDDPRASAIAEVMSNKTSKKILSAIAEKEMSEGDIAKELSLPLNTVGYNIDKLLKAGLIEKSKTYFWSLKGKKILTYKLSNKKILISPKKMISNNIIAALGSIIGIVLIILLISGIFSSNQLSQNISSNANNSNGNDFIKIKSFGSESELDNFIKDNSNNQRYDSFGYHAGAANGMANQLISAKSDVVAGAQPAAETSSNSGSASDYSQTNVQVAGVDEPDIVKNDGKYIYTISGNRVIIVDAYPANQIKNVSEINVSGNVQNILLNGNKLIVFSSSYSNNIYPQTGMAKIAVDFMPCRYGGCGGSSMTDVYIYDISDRTVPKLESNLSVEGSYSNARMIGNHVYLISSKPASLDLPRPPIYYANGVENKIAANEVMYYPGYEDSSFSFTSIFSINLENEEISKKVYLTGSTSTIYVSENNIYLTYQKTLSNKEYNNRFINEAILPLLSDELKSQVNEIIGSSKDINEKYSEVMFLIENYSMNLESKEKEIFDEKLQNSTNEFANKIAKEFEKTVIMKVNIDAGQINLKDNGEVPGQLLNQFAMDEYEGNLRIATTSGQTWEGNSLNHVFILDEKMNQIGSLEDIAPGERIYSVRFMGNRAYIVTFKNIDPFFVIDLSNANDPKVLGYLKIPGYSDYLHPYDENYVIGIGKDVNESIDADKVHSAGAVYYTAIQGIKISLFDVRDVENPKEVAKIVIGERGSDSYALSDHRAFLFNKDKNLLVIPITVNEIRNSSYSWNGQVFEESYPVFQGAYVFNITTSSIKVKGRITHNNESLSTFGPAKDAPIGSERKDSTGNIWSKIAINAWKTSANGNEYETYVDYQIDSFPDGFNSAQNLVLNYQTQIQRSLYIDNTLYTISQNVIKANYLENVSEIGRLDIGDSSNNYLYPTPMDSGGIAMMK